MFGKKKEEKPKFVVVDCVNNCLREKCPKWVIMYHNITDEKGAVTQKQEGKCADAWIPFILAEKADILINTIAMQKENLKREDNAENKG